MKNSRAFLTALVISLGLLFATACSKKSADGHAHGHHHHDAPHGGTLVELGEHQFNVEFVRDSAAGTLTAYVLDAHAENFIRLALPAIPVTAMVNGMPQPLLLAAAANSATGETVGNTSAFAAQAEWLKTASRFDVAIPALEIRGAKFTDVTFNFPKGPDDREH